MKFPRVPGFRFGGVHCGIKANDALDLGVIVADREVPTAGVFTRNRVRAAPVLLAAKRVRRRKHARAILVNSGNANACTGEPGVDAAERMTAAIAEQLDVPLAATLPASTGVIGVPLPVERIERAMPSLVQNLSTNSEAFARAILTTDRGPKVCNAAAGDHRVAAFAKGAGMIHPDMATTLAFVCTDAPVDPDTLQRVLREATEQTFNRITVDGDTSTNDSIFLMASGTGRPLKGKKLRALEASVHAVLESVATQIVADGEGAEHVVRVHVEGAKTDKHAIALARTIATSQLVKTALHGCDPNWGRILGAAGRAGVPFDADHVQLWIGSVLVFENGQTTMTAAVEKRAAKVMKKPRYDVRLVLHKGKAEAHYDTCDLGHEYVRINADYRS